MNFPIQNLQAKLESVHLQIANLQLRTFSSSPDPMRMVWDGSTCLPCWLASYSRVKHP